MESRQLLKHETGILCSHTQDHTMCWTFAFTLVTRSLTVFIQDATTLKGNKTGSVFTAQPHKTNWSLAASYWSVKAQMKWLDGAAFSYKLPFKHLLIKQRLDKDQLC